MQNRMKKYPLSGEKVEQLLREELNGTLCTLNEDGSPYATPVHFLYHAGKIYIHGLPKGRKIDNITARKKVSFSAFRMDKLLLDADETPCGTNTVYQSVIVQGTARLLEDFAQKKDLLEQLAWKYTPQLEGKALPEASVRGTAVIEVEMLETTGKYYG